MRLVVAAMVLCAAGAGAEERRPAGRAGRGAAAVPVLPAWVTVLPDRVLGPLPAVALGSNIQFIEGGDGILDPATGELREAAVAELAKLHLGTIRFPGGSWSQGYHWRDGVGPRASRPPGTSYFDGSPVANDYGTGEHLELCRRLGAEATITVNFESGTPREAANWVEYVNGEVPDQVPPEWTAGSWGGGDVAPAGYFAWLRSVFGHPEPYGVRRWEVGNEVYDRWSGEYSAAAYATRFLEFVRAMKAVDPTIRVAAVGYERADRPWREGDDPWNRTVAAIAGGEMDALHVHTYGPGTDGRTIVLLTAGPVEVPVTVEAGGSHRLSFLARGVDLYGPYPLPDGTVAVLRVSADGEPVAEVPLDRPFGGVYSVSIELEAGPHTLALDFINDVYDPVQGIDLNVALDSTLILDGPGGRRQVALASPGDAARSAMACSLVYGDEIRRIHGILQEATGRDDIEVWVTEANTLYGLVGFDLHRAERFESAAALAALAMEEIQAGAVMVQQWSAMENWFFGFLTDARSLGKRATFHVWRLLGELGVGEVVRTEVQGPAWNLDRPVVGMERVEGIPALRAMAVRRDDRVSLLLVNTAVDTALNVHVAMDGLPDEATASVTVVSAASPADRDVNPDADAVVFGPGVVGEAAAVGGERPIWIPTEGRLSPERGTVELWVQPAFTPGDGADHPVLSAGYSLHIGITPEGLLAALLAGEDGAGLDVAAGDVRGWAEGTWHHVAVTWDGDVIALYADGAELARGTRRALWTWIDPVPGLRVGSSVFQPGSGWRGAVDEVRLLAQPRSPAGIASDAFLGASGSPLAPLPGVTALLHLDGDLADAVRDERTRAVSGEAPILFGSLPVSLPPAGVALVVLPPPGCG